MSTLREQGHRFIFRDGSYTWAHPALMVVSDVDVTDLTDEEFERFVSSNDKDLNYWRDLSDVSPQRMAVKIGETA